MKLSRAICSVHRSVQKLFTVGLLIVLSLPAVPAPVSALAVNSTFTQLNLTANIETVGVVVTGTSLPTTAALQYRKADETTWHDGHPLMRIDNTRLAGSLFGLSPASPYDIKVVDGSTEITGSATTQPDELQFTPTTVLHVDDDAPSGGDGSDSAPFKTIQEGVNHATPGTQVLVADGIYREAVSFPASGSADKWIQVKAEGGDAILEGSENLPENAWKVYNSKAHVWYATIPASIRYLARDGQRYYNYDNLQATVDGQGHGKVPMNEGWYLAPNTTRLYVRSLDNPANHTWQVPRRNHAFDINARNWIWIEGFEMRYYGTVDSCGVCTKNASHVVIRKNKIHNVQLGIYFNWTGNEEQGNDTRVEFNEIYDPPVNEWPWKAVKATSMEGTAIVVRGHIGAIVRGNELHHFFNGIYTGSSAGLENSGIAFDADIYNNHIHHISDDGLEPEGACVNHRFRNNTVDTMLVGVSIAPITQGPTWVLRDTFSNFTGTSIKWDLNSDGVVLIYHNTSWTNAKDLNAMSMIHPVHNAIMRNNIFQGNGFAFEEPFTDSKGHDWNNDNWYTTRGSSGPHFKWEKVSYNTVVQLCADTGLECNGYEDPPGLTNPQAGDLTLLSSSPNLDRGISIPGINDDFKGGAPDVGRFESEFDRSPTVLSITRLDGNPTNSANVNFKVTFSEPVHGVDVSDFTLTTTGSLSGTAVTIANGSGDVYNVSVNTGNQDGTLRLNVKDDDSIADSAGNPLSGSGAGNGDFTLGKAYTVIKSSPINIVTTSVRSNKSNDGWVTESNETSILGKGINNKATTFYLGDNALDQQFRAILDFTTSSLPDNAVIVSATLKIKKLSVTGTDPFTTHQIILFDIKNGSFGAVSLQPTDFQTPASLEAAGKILNTPVDNWYSSTLDEATLQYINKTGPTQFRLRFRIDDNDDLGADTIKFYSGDATVVDFRPILQIEYYVP